jgi:molybdopterin-binding protein
MRIRQRNTLWGEVTSVAHSANSCRITIELKGTLEQTAIIMKESTVELGILEGAQVCAEVDASSVLVGICQDGQCAVSG